MSFEALTWANKQEVGNSTAKFILVLIANLSDENFESYPSYAYLSKSSECSERTVKRAVKFLVEKGFIEVTARYKNKKQLSNVYKILRGVKMSPPDKLVEAEYVQSGVSETTPNTKEETKYKPFPLSKEKYPMDFEYFWFYYPRKEGKWSASKKYLTIMKKENPDFNQLMKQVKLYAEKVKGVEKKFILLPETWLNKKRYLDKEEETKTNLNSLAG